jgi:H+/gluconate symporter-like permease
MQSMALGVTAIVLSLGLLMVVAYRGLSVIVFAPLLALLAVALSGLPLLPSFTESFMGHAAGYIKSFFPLFLLGAIFGKLMETSGAAGSIAETIVRTLGDRRAIAAVVFSCAVLTYGGVSLFVVAFAVYPFAAVIFREAAIPKRLIPGAIALGSFTFTMDALPGSPQIQNLIPTRYFGTDAYAAPFVGLFGGTGILVGGLIWLEFRRARAIAAGENYGDHHQADSGAPRSQAGPHVLLAILPLLLVLVANLVLSRTSWSVAGWYAEASLRRSFPSMDVNAVVSTWALIVALFLGIAATLTIHWRRMTAPLSGSLSAATAGALLAIFNTASEVGFGNVIKSMPGFQSIQGWVFGASRYALVSEAVAVNVLAGITGSASGGLSIALDVMSQHFLTLAHDQGISPELLHRIASMASGGMDTLPHNGAVITLLAITGLTHRESYLDIFAITVLKTAIVFALAFAISLTR